MRARLSPVCVFASFSTPYNRNPLPLSTFFSITLHKFSPARLLTRYLAIFPSFYSFLFLSLSPSLARARVLICDLRIFASFFAVGIIIPFLSSPSRALFLVLLLLLLLLMLSVSSLDWFVEVSGGGRRFSLLHAHFTRFKRG